MTYKVMITSQKLAQFGINITTDTRAIEKITAKVQQDFPAITGVTLYQAPLPGVPTASFLLTLSDDIDFDIDAFREFVSHPKFKNYGVVVEEIPDVVVPPPDDPPTPNPEV